MWQISGSKFKGKKIRKKSATPKRKKKRKRNEIREQKIHSRASTTFSMSNFIQEAQEYTTFGHSVCFVDTNGTHTVIFNVHCGSYWYNISFYCALALALLLLFVRRLLWTWTSSICVGHVRNQEEKRNKSEKGGHTGQRVSEERYRVCMFVLLLLFFFSTSFRSDSVNIEKK